MNVLLLSCIAGVLGTGIGGLIGIFVSKAKPNSTNNILSFAGGCMLGMVFFSIFPEAEELTNYVNVLLSALFGVLLLALINYLMNGFNKTKQVKIAKFISVCSSIKTYKHPKTLKLFKAGLIMFFAISIHNIPEGMAISSVGYLDYKSAFTLAILLLIHNIPEGMAISTPLVAGGMNKFKSFLFSLLAGASTIIGGLIGLAIININESLSALALAFSGGAMLNVTFCDIYPEAFENNHYSSHIYNFIGIALIYVVINVV